MKVEYLDFITFCVGSLADALNKSASQVYNALRSSGVLNNYIIPCYDVLHVIQYLIFYHSLAQLHCEHEFMKPVQLLQRVMGFRRGGFRTGGIVGVRMHDVGVQGIAQSSCALELQPAVVDGASSGVAQNTERLDRPQGGGAMPPCFRVQILVGAVVLVAKFMFFNQTRHCVSVGFQIMAIA